MRFLADMGVDLRVVKWLREQGHDAIHLREENLQRLPNGEIFEKALREKRIILTFDLDFGEIAALSHGKEVSVVVFRLLHARAPHVIKHLSGVLDHSAGILEKGVIITVEESRYRSRPLPIYQEGDFL